jgi:NitT/TauT family transport system substrate-binding protein
MIRSQALGSEGHRGGISSGLRGDQCGTSRAGRRAFVWGLGALASHSLFSRSAASASEPAPETARIRLFHTPALCLAPSYLAEELLRLEGFSEVQYVELDASTYSTALAAGDADLGMSTAPGLIPAIDAGQPIVVLCGVHAGCYELFARGRIRSVRDLKRGSVAIGALGSGDHIFLASMVAYVGMDPRKDINWVESGGYDRSMSLFVDGRVDAFLAFAPQPQELRARKIGRMILSTTYDRPWSQYFCCMVAAHREFVARHPVAAKRALRAILKGADLCAQDPERAARYLVSKGYERRYETALEVLRELPYRRWRDADPEDTLRFHALRLHEVGMIRNSPNRLLAQGTQWRFLDELKRELKA